VLVHRSAPGFCAFRGTIQLNEARLPALHREPPGELAGVVITPVRRLRIHLGVQFP